VRSLTLKLVLAFLLTSIAGMALASIFIRQSVSSEFDSYVIAQQRASFTDDVAAYYAANGSWSGVDRWLRDRAARRCACALCWPTARAW
jgi:two-component system OmpR family sensor kinase/two-component system sensor histidine kinase BaeS